MKRTSFSGMDCSIAHALDQVGEWWSLLIVRDAFFGFTRFEQFQTRLGIARNVLADRLDNLVTHGILERTEYQQRPQRFDYRLSRKGQELFPVLMTLRQWGDRWATEGEPPITIEHRGCGHITDAILDCSHCGDEMGHRDVRIHGNYLGRPAGSAGAHGTPAIAPLLQTPASGGSVASS